MLNLQLSEPKLFSSLRVYSPVCTLSVNFKTITACVLVTSMRYESLFVISVPFLVHSAEGIGEPEYGIRIVTTSPFSYETVSLKRDGSFIFGAAKT